MKQCTHRHSRSAPVLVPFDIVLGNDTPCSMREAMDVLHCNGAQIDVAVDITNVVRLGIVVPRDDLDNVRLDVVNGLLPPIVP